jgi:hypothetical protein
MARRKKTLTPGPINLWTVETSIQINGRNVQPGTELKIRGERGRFRFIKYVKTEKENEWIDVWGGSKGHEQWRSFKLDKVRTVHYKNQTVQNLAQVYKDKKQEIKLETT